MIDPDHVTNFSRSQNDLEEFAVFAVLVVGKTAKTIAPRLENLLAPGRPTSPFSYLRMLSQPVISQVFLANGIGCYNQKANTVWQLCNANLNLYSCTTEDLEQIKGIGPKTSRFFIMHSRPDQRFAALDTHILKGLAELGYTVPKVTPSSKSLYRKLEQLFLTECDRQGKMAAELDLEWWRKFSNKKTT